MHHDAVLFIGGLTATWAFEGPERLSVPVRGRYVVNHQGLQLEAGEAGLGVVRLLPFRAQASLEAGRLVRVLPEWHSPPARLYVVTQGTAHRTAALALSGLLIDATTALRWGLVDRIDDASFTTEIEEPS
jgi:DNA-binding transcriptional LysR family regulator